MEEFNTHGGYFAPKDYTRINTGGSHDENPNGGVQYGTDGKGIPNLVEQGESIYDDFVYSDKIVADENVLSKYKIPNRYSGKRYSDIANSLVDEASERPNDPISNNGMNAMLLRLAEAQEEQKQIEKQKELEKIVSKLSPEELESLYNMLANENGLSQDNQQTEVPQPNTEQDQQAVANEQYPQEEAMQQEGPQEAVHQGQDIMYGDEVQADEESEVNNADYSQDSVPQGQEIHPEEKVTQGEAEQDGVTRQFASGGHLPDTNNPIAQRDNTLVSIPQAAEMYFRKTEPLPEHNIFGVVNPQPSFGGEIRQGSIPYEQLLKENPVNRAIMDLATFGISEIPLAIDDAKNGDYTGAALLPLSLIGSGVLGKALGKGVKAASKFVNKEAIKVAKVALKKKASEIAKLDKLLNNEIKPTVKTIKANNKSLSQNIPGLKSDILPENTFNSAEHPDYFFSKNILNDAVQEATNTANNIGYIQPVEEAANNLLHVVVPKKVVRMKKPINVWKAAKIAGSIAGAGEIGNVAIKGLYTWMKHRPKNEPEVIPENKPEVIQKNEQKIRQKNEPEIKNNSGNKTEQEIDDENTGQISWGYEYKKGGKVHTKPTVNKRTPLGLPTIHNMLTDPSFQTLEVPNKQYGLLGPTRYEFTNRHRGGNPILPTLPRYAGIGLNSILALYNAGQSPDRYYSQSINPSLPYASLHLTNPIYNPVDENMLINAVAAQNAGNAYAIRNSGLGASLAPALLANDYNLGRNIGDSYMKVRDANNQRLNDVIARRNANEQTRGQFNLGINNTRSNILNSTRLNNLNNALKLQMINDEAVGRKYAAIQNTLNSISEGLAGIGRENMNMNMITTNPAIRYKILPDGSLAYQRGDGGFLLINDNE